MFTVFLPNSGITIANGDSYIFWQSISILSLMRYLAQLYCVDLERNAKYWRIINLWYLHKITEYLNNIIYFSVIVHAHIQINTAYHINFFFTEVGHIPIVSGLYQNRSAWSLFKLKSLYCECNSSPLGSSCFLFLCLLFIFCRSIRQGGVKTLKQFLGLLRKDCIETFRVFVEN